MSKDMEIVVECEDGTDPNCIENGGLFTLTVETDALTRDQIEQMKLDEEENGFVSLETLEEIREAIDDEEWASETICEDCGSDSERHGSDWD